MYRQEAREEYAAALKAGQKTYKELTSRDQYPYLPVLDEMLEGNVPETRRNLGILEVPSDLFEGTRTLGRRNAFAAGFLPLLSVDTEFAQKWISLCADHLGETGIHDPVKCYEYLGKFYVQEGNKRVSVLKWNGAATIPAQVMRLMPPQSEEPEIKLYYEFLDFYQVTRLYTVSCRLPGSYGKLLQTLGGSSGEPWDDRKRLSLSSALIYFQDAFRKLGGKQLDVGVGDALLVWLRVHTIPEIKEMGTAELKQNLEALWPDIVALTQPEPIQVQPEPAQPPRQTILEKILPSPRPGRLNIAFINEYYPAASNWCMAHERARLDLEQTFGDRVSTRVYNHAHLGEEAEACFEKAVAEGAQVIFSTTPPLVDACLQASVRHPQVHILNCSVDIPYTSIRTYYCRVYEAKFITGAIAGAMTPDGRIGYVGSYPIYGVPASINAFALGAQLTNPDARVYLGWSCTQGNPMDSFRQAGFRVVSNRDTPVSGELSYEYGTYLIDSKGNLQALASPCWHWDVLYEKIVRSILAGQWGKEQHQDGKAVNYWWGMRSGAVDITLADNLPEGPRHLAQILKDGIITGTLEPFRRPIIAQDGSCKNDGAASLSMEEILRMDWLCANVVGHIPTLEEVLPASRNVVRFQGVFRDRIPPTKEQTLL